MKKTNIIYIFILLAICLSCSTEKTEIFNGHNLKNCLVAQSNGNLYGMGNNIIKLAFDFDNATSKDFNLDKAVLHVKLYGEYESNLDISTGEYTALEYSEEDSELVMKFERGQNINTPGGNYLDGTYLEETNGEESVYHIFTDGKITVSKSVSGYRIDFDIYTADGKRLSARYDGVVDLVKFQEKYNRESMDRVTIDETEEISMNGFNTNNADYTTTQIQFFLNNSKDMINLYVLTAKNMGDTPTVPEGKFVFEEDPEKAGTAMAGYSDPNDEMVGSHMFMTDNGKIYYLASGEINITKIDDVKYEIAVKAKSGYGSDINMTVTGPLSIY